MPKQNADSNNNANESVDGNKKEETSLVHSNLLRSFLAGAFAGGCAKTIIAPIDRAKIHFQVTTTPFSIRRVFSFLFVSAKRNGFFSLWRGNTAQLARVLPYAAIQFASNEQYKRMLDIRPNEQVSPKLLFLAGALAGSTSVAATYPFDIARARLAVTSASRYRSLLHMFMVTLREEGIFGVYRGFSVTLLGQIPYTGVAFCTYESLKRLNHQQQMSQAALTELDSEKRKLMRTNPLNTFFNGAIAGLLGQTVAYPLDVVRRRWQTAGEVVDVSALNSTQSVSSTSRSKSASSPVALSLNNVRQQHSYAVPKSQLGIWATMRHIADTEGIRKGLFKGVSMNWIKGPIGIGISFLTFESTRDLLQRAGV